jgi:acyl-CoA thioester hydrolase
VFSVEPGYIVLKDIGKHEARERKFMPYTKVFEVRWADLDANFHMRNTAYLEYAEQVRINYFNENGFPTRRFKELGFGPVLFSERVEYMKEIGPDQKININCRMGGLSADGRKWRFYHQVFRDDGKEAARVTGEGAWLDISARKLRVPPEELLRILNSIDRTDDFINLK